MRILIGTGSSGGHIFPALALAQELKAQGENVLLVLPQKAGGRNIPITDKLAVRYIPAANLSLKLNRKNIIGLWFFLSGAWESLRVVVEFKPEVAVGFGSLNTVALIFWAWLFRAKTLIHEQNVTLGRANKLLAKLVDKVAVSFAQTRQSLNIDAQKIVLTGNPLRSELVPVERVSALDFFGFKDARTTILIMGGSQGSHRLNEACAEFLSAYPEKGRLQLIHICGFSDLTGLAAKYAAMGLAYKLFDFFPQMQYAYSVADLVVCRAGATTIAELQRFMVPAILVPYPFAYAHQSANARVLEEQGTALIVQDEELATEGFHAKFKQALSRPQALATMRRAYPPQVAPEAAKLLTEQVLSFKLSHGQ